MKKRDIIGIAVSGGLCLILALVSMLIPGEAQTGVMFASYVAGYVAFMWALYSAYRRFMVQKKDDSETGNSVAE